MEEIYQFWKKEIGAMRSEILVLCDPHHSSKLRDGGKLCTYAEGGMPKFTDLTWTDGHKYEIDVQWM